VSNAICLSLTFAKNFLSLSANTSNFGALMVGPQPVRTGYRPREVISRMRCGIT
jgi:hypothetical protein